MPETLSVTTAEQTPPEGFVVGMPGEHGFYVPADLKERITAQHVSNPGIPTPRGSEIVFADPASPAENIDLARQAVDGAYEVTGSSVPSETVSQHFARSIEEIKHPFTARKPYSSEKAEQERPLTHYTKAGNIFQILRFGVQSNNFKNRVNAIRASDPSLDTIAPEMTGLRIKQGGSYQGRDSISLDQYMANPKVPPGNISIFINPGIKTYGLDSSERDETTGYGHGIVTQGVDGDFKIGNPTAYITELLAANVVPPSDIRAIVIPERTSILRGLADATRENAILYSQTMHQDRQAAKEDLLANCRLLADLSENHPLEDEIDAFAPQIDGMKANDIAKSLKNLQTKALQRLVGEDVELTEETLRIAIQEKFNIQFLTLEQ
jgi:hypothetical protein